MISDCRTWSFNFWIVGLASLFLVISMSFTLYSQNVDQQKEKAPKPWIPKSLGLSTPDSAYSVNLSFRVQQRVLMNSSSTTNLSPEIWEARVRRMRLNFRGHVFSSRWTYRLQLSFSRGDMDWNDADRNIQNSSPNVLRDAMIYYKVSKNLSLGFGQTKLPGNRQRVISSGALQFFDRSPVNANFTTDRDFGVFGDYTFDIGKTHTNIKTAISSGEGRNSLSSNSGLAYTGRIEFLPFGKFSEGGDFFEGDVFREPKPKLAISGGYHFNDLAVRTQGQLGNDLLASRSFQTVFADLLFKYKGFSIYSEFIKRSALTDPVTVQSPDLKRFLIVGEGVNTQISYCFPSHWEIAGRYSITNPARKIEKLMKSNEQVGLGVSKYIVGHKLKTQFNIFYNKGQNPATTHPKNEYFFAVFQVELGI
jgi:hypothetical protein